MMHRFLCYRQNAPEDHYKSDAANHPDDIQFEGVVFSDGTVCIRWLTEYRSHSVWKCWDDLRKIHGHPEYGTIIKWLDE